MPTSIFANFETKINGGTSDANLKDESNFRKIFLEKIDIMMKNYSELLIAQTTRIPGRVKSKQWKNYLRPTFQMSIKSDRFDLFPYFFLQNLGTSSSFWIFNVRLSYRFRRGCAGVPTAPCQNLQKMHLQLKGIKYIKWWMIYTL